MDLKSYKERSKVIKTIIFFTVLILGILAIFFLQTKTAENNIKSFSIFPKVFAQTKTETSGGKTTTTSGGKTTTDESKVTPGKPINLCDPSLGVSCAGNNLAGVKSGSDGVIFVIMNIVYFLIFVASGFAILFIVLGGYKMITSNGQEDKYTEGLSTLKYASIGLVVCILSITFVYVISQLTVGIKLF
jgi:flagellar basal body-associated protein FliL